MENSCEGYNKQGFLITTIALPGVTNYHDDDDINKSSEEKHSIEQTQVLSGRSFFVDDSKSDF